MFLLTAVSSHCASYKWPETNKHTVHAQTQNTTQILSKETFFYFGPNKFSSFLTQINRSVHSCVSSQAFPPSYCTNILGHLCPDCFRSFIIWFYVCVKFLTYKACLLYYTAKIYDNSFKKMLWVFYLKTSCLIQCAIFYYL